MLHGAVESVLSEILASSIKPLKRFLHFVTAYGDRANIPDSPFSCDGDHTKQGNKPDTTHNMKKVPDTPNYNFWGWVFDISHTVKKRINIRLKG